MDRAELRQQSLQRLHILDAVTTALERRVELLDLVDSSRSADEAVTRLRAEWGFTESQAWAALDLQVRRLAQQERARMVEERDDLLRLIPDLSG